MFTHSFVLAANQTNPFAAAAAPIVALINSALVPLLSIVFALGALYCVLLGVKLAKADEPQEREKAKNALKNAIIGFILIFVLIVAMNAMRPALEQWVYTSTGNAVNLHEKLG